MEAKAKLRHLRISPKKVRLVLDIIRGLKIEQAKAQLQLMNKKSSEPVLKLLESAVANATNNFDLAEDNLYIKEVFANEGQTLKRWMPRAFGRATPIRKRTSHIEMTLAEVIPSKDKEKDNKKKTDKKDDIVKVDSLDQIKESDNEKAIDSKDSKDKPKNNKAEKGFAKKVFRRKSA